MTQLDTRQESAGRPAMVAASGRFGAGAWWNDAKVRAILYQILVLLALIALFGWFASNAIINMRRANIASGFGFLDNQAGFGISESLIPYNPAETYGRALVVGFFN